MMYEYMTLNDDTAIAHSDIYPDGSVKVYIERPVFGGFKSASCILPQYKWEDVAGFSQNDVEKLQIIIQNNAHLIMEFAAEGGFANASGF